MEPSEPFEEDPRNLGSILTHLRNLLVMRLLLHKNLINRLQNLEAVHMVQPFCHIPTVGLSLSNHLFILQTTLLEYSPFHVHKNFHSALLLGSDFTFFPILIDSLLAAHRLNQNLLLMILRPLFRHIYIHLNMIIFNTNSLLYRFFSSLWLQFG